MLAEGEKILWLPVSHMTDMVFMPILLRLLALLLASSLLGGCATLPTPDVRREHATGLAAKRGWQLSTLSTGQFDLVVFSPAHFQTNDILTVYIEGDGFAWLDRSTPSSDPTPVDPLGLRLALHNPIGNAVYLARPCQYVDAQKKGCASRYWTGARFAPEVVEATSRAMDVLKARFGARRLQLVGYSGGGAVAELVAARRNDVGRVITVAGNLDPRAWAAYHRIDPLDGSLDPVDYVDRLKRIPQWHFVGNADKVIPPLLAETFSERFPPSQRPVVRIVPKYDHHCCWADNWAQLMGELPQLSSSDAVR